MSKPKLQISCESKDNKAVIKIEGYISNWDSIAARFKASVENLVANGIKDLEVYINSGGGSVFEANEIANVLDAFTGNKVARLGALVASAATYIASKCDKVIASSNTAYMIHKPMMMVDGNADQIEAQLKNLRNLQANYALVYSKKTGLTIKEIDALWKEDFWMNAQEAIDKKFVDEVDGETTAALSIEDIKAVQSMGYKHIPQLAATLTITNQTTQNNNMKDLFIAAAGLPANSTDAQIIAHYEVVKAKAAKADELQAKLDKVTADANAAKIKAVLDASEFNKQTLPSEREYYTKALTNDFEGTKAHIEAKPKLSKLSAETNESNGGNAGGVDTSKWTYADFMEKDPKALEVMAEQDEARFKTLAKAHYGKDI